MRKTAFIALFSFFALSGLVHAQDASIVGKWKTIDDKTNRPKSIVQITQKNGKHFGTITELYMQPGEDPDPVCDKCADDDPRKDQPVRGMEIIKDLVKNGNDCFDGTILDPENGKVYTCKIWLEEDRLKVRGYLAFFYRTQTWIKAE